MEDYSKDTITEGRRGSKTSNINAVFYADSYHPIQAGSIDGTDITPHDNGVYRALICASANLYDPTNDPKVTGNPYCTVFVGNLSHATTEDSLKEAMSRYGKIKNVRLVRHIVTGASRHYAFVAYESERDMRHAYEAAHHTIIDGSQVIVDYSRQQLMPGWIPRRLGGGLGGHKESGQLRFGGRERPFRAPLRPVPHEELKKLGISLPPEGRYMSRHQVPPPPRRPNSDGWHEKSEFNKHHELSYQSNDVLDHIPSSSKENKRKRSSSQQEGRENQESDHARKRSRHSEDKSHSDSDNSDFSHRRKHQHHHRHRHRERHRG